MKWPIPTPVWITIALTYVGLREIPGKKHNPTILRWLKNLKAWWAEDETPWCGTFVAECLRQSGLPIPQHWYRAKAYSTYGSAITKAANTIPFGAIAVKSRVGGGHVFFAVARSADGKIIFGLGANQSNKVSIVPFTLTEIDTVRWADDRVPRIPLPVSTIGEIGAVQPGSEA